MVEYLQQLKDWSDANAKDARRDAIKFWSFKIPAIVVATGSGLIASLHWPALVSAVTGLIGGFCVTLDGIVRPGAMLKTHQRAVFDLGILSNSMKRQWDIGTLQHRSPDELAAGIISEAEERWQEIAVYLKQAETGGLQDRRPPES
jgi:hypothetical protein